MRKDSFARIKSFIKKSDHIVIVTHWSPDGDAMGSSLALYNYLLQLKKKPVVVVPNEYPEFLNWLPGNNKVLNFQREEKKVRKLVEKADAIFTLDFNSFKRIEKLGEIVEASKAPKMLIDHHQQPDNYADYVFHDVKASSTCELIYELIAGLGDKNRIDKKIANCLYTGLMTDTGSFRFPSVTANTHKILGHLMESGALPHEVHSAVYDTYSVERMKLLGYALTEKMIVLSNKQTAYMTLTENELKRFHYQKGDTEGLVNYPFSIKGIKFSALFTEMDGKIKISFRSKGKFDVNAFARNYFNGGGHINAAGGRSDATLEATIKKFLALVNDASFKIA
ncbi:MAG: DHH family phosphoesterase [Bacteroidia bacterium]